MSIKASFYKIKPKYIPESDNDIESIKLLKRLQHSEVEKNSSLFSNGPIIKKPH